MRRSVLEAKRFGIYDCRADSLLRDATCKMASRDVSALVVTNEAGHLQGIISRTDLLRIYINNPNWETMQVSSAMSTDVVTVTPDATMDEVARLLLQDKIHRVVVVENGDTGDMPIAVVSDSDFVHHMAKETCTAV